jgi:hypothetical protein
LQLRDLARASALAQEGLKLAPNDPQAWITASDVDRARDHIGQALHELQRARELRLQQLGTPQPDVETPSAAVPSPQARGSATEPVEVAGTLLEQPESLASPVTEYPPRPFAVVALVDDSSDNTAPQSPNPVPLTAPAVQPATEQVMPAPADTTTSPFGQTAPAQQNAPPPNAGYGQYYPNPFRSTPSAGFGTSSETGTTLSPAGPTPDAITAEIDRSIAALRDQMVPTMQVGFDFRDRSGQSGLGGLDEYAVPMEATFSPAGVGRVTVLATPTILEAGHLGGSPYNQAQFGTGALGVSYNPATTATSYTGALPGDQHATGVGLDVAYQLNNLKADLGTTPLGFTETNIIGGVEWTPQISDRLRLQLTAGRRAVDDSVLSYAGTTDAFSGAKWGGVTRNGGHANLAFSAGKADFYAGAGAAELLGYHVKNNTEVDGGAGVSFPVWHDADKVLRSGLDLVYFGYSKNLGYFTYGQGGYFSPRDFFAALIPVDFKQIVNDALSYDIGGAVGVQTFHESSSPYYPLDPNLMAALAASNVPGLSPYYAATSTTGVAGNVHGALDYQVSPSLHLGARVSYAHGGNYDETKASVFARYIFNGAD